MILIQKSSPSPTHLNISHSCSPYSKAALTNSQAAWSRCYHHTPPIVISPPPQVNVWISQPGQ